jgi:hypothetical protein
MAIPIFINPEAFVLAYKSLTPFGRGIVVGALSTSTTILIIDLFSPDLVNTKAKSIQEYYQNLHKYYSYETNIGKSNSIMDMFHFSTMQRHMYFMYNPESYTKDQYEKYKLYYDKYKNSNKRPYCWMHIPTPEEYGMFMTIKESEGEDFCKYVPLYKRIIRRTANAIDKLQNGSYSYLDYKPESQSKSERT